ncbi:MAG: Elongation factor Ts [Legionellaceae bacterium]
MSITISAELVKELRERTGAGMMECKKALVAAMGNIDDAIEAMRKAGQAKADKKAGNIAAEGVTTVLINEEGKGVILEVNCQTDFVANDNSFKAFTAMVAEQALAKQTDDLNTIAAIEINGTTIENTRQELIAKIGENVQIRRAKFLQTEGIIGAYIHGGRISVLIELQGGDKELAKDIAMHIAASNPLFISPSEVSTDLIEKEREIFEAQANTSGKPKEIIEKMVEGRIKKFLDEISLLGQPFVKDPSITIGNLLKKSNATVTSFIRFGLGEGIEKKVTNFAEEVMAQVKGS